MDNIIPFPSHKVGIRHDDRIAVVTSSENGKALTLKVHKNQEEIGVFAHSDFVMNLKNGDWVRFDITKYGAVVIEQLAKPGTRPLPRVDYLNGQVYLHHEDPAWRLYGHSKTDEQKEQSELG